MGSLHISATLVPRGPAAAFILDGEQVATVGEGAKRFPVVATINGHPFRLSVARMGGEFLLGLRREVREQAGVEAGDVVDLRLELDSAPRQVARAARSEGIVTTAVVLDAGLSHGESSREPRHGWLVRRHHGVYLVGAIAGPLAEEMAAVQAIGEDSAAGNRPARRATGAGSNATAAATPSWSQPATA
jgi:hypothetical protein